jgi:AcrR family transcriptional regulator
MYPMSATANRGRPRAMAVDLAILRAALSLFIERGVEGTSMEQIAKHAGVGKPSIYRRWPNKEEVIAAAIETVVAEEVQWATLEAIETQSPYALVEAAIESAAATVTTAQYRALIARVFGSAVSHPALMALYWQRYILPRRAAAARLLEQARAHGTVGADADLDVAIDMMVGAVTFRVLRPDPPYAEEMQRYLRTVYRQVGLLPPT